MGILIGVDGGGTHSTAVAVAPDGRVLAVTYGEGLNHHNIGIPTARTRLAGMIRALRTQCGEPVVLGVCVGMSALDGPADEKTLRQFAVGELAGFPLDLQSDAYIALVGFAKGAPGLIVICGTGSMLLMVCERRRQYVSGGWGYLLQDAGSGYTLAREALLAVTAEADGVGPATALTADALDCFGAKTARGLIDVVYAPSFTPDRMAGFARCVLARAEQGEDAAAAQILRGNMERLAAQAACMMKKAPAVRRVGLYGGIFNHSAQARSLFAAALTRQCPEAEVCRLDCPPELGAVIHLLLREGEPDAQVLARMQKTYRGIYHGCH